MNTMDELHQNFERVLIVHKKTIFRQCTFTYNSQKLLRPKEVYLHGSFDNWKNKHKLYYNTIKQIWTLTLSLKPGEFYFKFLVDGVWECNEGPKTNDVDGNINNILVV